MSARKAADLIRDEADLLAEMHALAAMMPGEEADLPTDAEVEAGFDNMPV